MIFSIEFDVVQNSTFSQKWSGPRSRGGGGGQHHRGPSPRFRDEIYLSTAPKKNLHDLVGTTSSAGHTTRNEYARSQVVI